MAKSDEAFRRIDTNRAKAHQVFKDPVCGMEVTAQKSYSAIHRGKEFRFCSLACLDKFRADPQAFVER